MRDLNVLEPGQLSGQTALVRVDFNVPMDENGQITDDTRLRSAVPTVRLLMALGAKVALLAHFGRPKGTSVASMSLAPIAPAFAAVLGAPVGFAGDCVGAAAAAAITALAPGGVILLENTRFHKGEEKNDPVLADAMAALGDVYVNDAFSAAHRAHVSTEGLARRLPAYPGLAMQRELAALDAALGRPERPVLAVVGGAKVSTKIDLLKNLVGKVDRLAVGGGMANTFLHARGFDVGGSLCEADLGETVHEIEAAARASGCEILLPVDVVAATAFKAHAPSRICAPGAVGKDEMILDAGPETIARLNAAMDASRTVIWNGPLGAFELAPFDTATVEAARHAAGLAKAGSVIAVAGGGDTVSELNLAGAAEDFTFVSTAGGAFLEWMEGKPLPGVEALTT
jgi:phosphoglycerate kinase